METKESLAINSRVMDWVERNPIPFQGLMNALDNETSYFNVFSRSSVVLIENEYGYCTHCTDMVRLRSGESIKALYRMKYWSETYEDVIYSDTNACADCLEKSVLTEYLPTRWVRDNYVEGMLFDKSTYPKPSFALDTCAACDLHIAPHNMYSPSWMRNLELVEARDNVGNVYKAHKSCAFWCGHCSAWRMGAAPNRQAITERVNVNNEYICGWCWHDMEDEGDWDTCEACSTWTNRELRRSHVNDDMVCRSCYDSEYRCDSCDYWYCDGDDHDCDDSDDSDRRSYLIHNYSYKPGALFFGKAPYYFGLELEVEARNGEYYEGAEVVCNALDKRIYLKHDGSLSNGFEIVTHPHSLEQLQTEFNWDVLEQIKNMGFRSWSTSTCGLHVHVSRTAFSAATSDQRDTHQIKFMKLIYDNKDQVQKLAGRKSSWAKFDDKGQIIRKVKYGYQSANRYSAVNVENENTLEVRVFRGSLRKERVLSAVEFVHAAVEYTRDLKVIPKESPFAWTSFLGFVTANKTTYPNLLTIVNEILSKSSQTISRQEETV